MQKKVARRLDPNPLRLQVREGVTEMEEDMDFSDSQVDQQNGNREAEAVEDAESSPFQAITLFFRRIRFNPFSQ